MEHWGEIVVTRIEDASDFWCLFDELFDDDSGFVHNRDVLLDAFKSGNLYGLRVEETKLMRRDHPLFAVDAYGSYSWYLLPCLCVKRDNIAEIIWTHTRARRNGFAKKMVEQLGITKANHPLPESKDFWRAVGIGS